MDWISSTECTVKGSSSHPQLRAEWGVDPRPSAGEEQERDEVKGAQELENLD